MTNNLEKFLETVITTEKGFFVCLVGPPSSQRWYEVWFQWPDDKEEIIARAYKESEQGNNVYFSAHLFREPKSLKQNVLPSRTIQADLDNARVDNLEFEPAVLVETSPSRHQGYWVLRDSDITLDELEDISKRLTYSIEDSDHSGWAIGRKVRVPGTRNFKYTSTPEVKIARTSEITHTARSLLERLPPVEETLKQAQDSEAWVDTVANNPPAFEVDPRVVLMKYQQKRGFNMKVAQQYVQQLPEGERSEALWALMVSMLEQGATNDEVFYVAKNSANNKFAGRRHAGDRDLAKDVIRARAHVERQPGDIKLEIARLRRAPGSPSDKKRAIARAVRTYLSKVGDFMITMHEDSRWYLEKDNPRPISVEERSEKLIVLLDRKAGLNATEGETKFLLSDLITYTEVAGKNVVSAVLSHYNTNDRVLTVHGGDATAYRVTADRIETVRNGQYGILFPWGNNNDVFIPRGEPVDDWTQEVFADYFQNISGMTHEEANTLIRVWMMFLLFRDAAINRPILALFGQPGSGKSTLFRSLYTILYGPNKGVDSVTTPDNFDSVVAEDPFVAFDNVDKSPVWLPDKLALSAARSEAKKRKLYTDTDTVIVRRQALVGVTAHNPQFGREDVVDRMILLFFNRFSQYKDESLMIDALVERRDFIWKCLLTDAQRVIATPLPDRADMPQFRITDFAYLGLWIARGLGVEDSFRSALSATKKNQVSFNLGEEDVLIDALTKWVEKRKDNDYKTSGEIWQAITLHGDALAIQRSYKNAVQLGKKLWTLQDSLSSVFDVKWEYGKAGSRKWKIDLRDNTNGNGAV